MSVPLTALVLARNEAAAIHRCVAALAFCDQVIVIDSRSVDDTADIATAAGAEILQFEWDGTYPKKKQWAMSHPSVRNDWVLHIDADEVVTPALAEEITIAVQRATSLKSVVAYEIPLSYWFMGKPLRHGHRVRKRALVRRSRSKFPEVGDLGAPGITEVEGHYQPEVDGDVRKLSKHLIHDDPDPLSDWIARHNRYSDWEAYLIDNPSVKLGVRSRRSASGQLFDRLPFKAFAFFVYAFIFRLGFLDGRAGFDYAFGLSWYYWSISAKVRDNRRPTR